jgi:tRNA pseudouridine38-40 synthase
LHQIANFKTTSGIPCSNLVTALNDTIPSTIRIQQAREVPDSFHARYDVRSKTYWYRILQTGVCSPFLSRFVHHYPWPLDRSGMSQAARLLEGRHDFTSFAAVADYGVREPDSANRDMEDDPNADLSGDQRIANKGPIQRSGTQSTTRPSGSMIRTISSSNMLWKPRTSMLIYQVSGNGFLHHMVRNIVGTLIKVGRGRLTPGDMASILCARDRTKAGPTAPAKGLCLMKVEY